MLALANDAPVAPPLKFAHNNAQFPKKLGFLFQPHRYKVSYGGRGATKSWGYARALLILGTLKPLRVLCGREIQKSIDESVHALLKDQIQALGLSYFYRVQEKVIYGLNGTEFTFHGLKHNIDNIKSIEGTDIVWVEEASLVSHDSWEKLIPTIRKPGSEIWVTFNPDLDTDDTYTRFVRKPPPSAFVQYLTWRDNPWLSQELRDEKDHLFNTDLDAYNHVWEGHCRRSLSGAIYAAELRALETSGRVQPVPYDPSVPVDVGCDLGWSDYTSLWFGQRVGMQYRLLQSHQDRLKLWPHYLKYIQTRSYVIGTVYLPHDAAAGQLGAKSIEQQAREAGFRVVVVPRVASVTQGINVVRTLFPICYFDQDQCDDGLAALRRYRYEDGSSGQTKSQPRHDEHSHFADGFRTLACGLEVPKDETTDIPPPPTIALPYPTNNSTGWMR